MAYVFHSGQVTAEPGFARHWAGILRGAPAAITRKLAETWRHAAARREFNGLDDIALRDLGIGRGEFDSYWAETHGRAEPTRLRVTRHIAGRRECRRL